MHDDFTGVHGIAHGVLGVAEYGDTRAVQVRAQAVAGHAMNDDLLFVQSVADVALAETIFDGDFPVGAVAHEGVEGLKVHAFSVDGHCGSPPIRRTRSLRENAMSCGFSKMRSKSTCESGVCSRMSAV